MASTVVVVVEILISVLLLPVESMSKPRAILGPSTAVPRIRASARIGVLEPAVTLPKSAGCARSSRLLEAPDRDRESREHEQHERPRLPRDRRRPTPTVSQRSTSTCEVIGFAAPSTRDH
jgi:hypothetical protein